MMMIMITIIKSSTINKERKRKVKEAGGKTSLKTEDGVMRSVPFTLSKIAVLSTILPKLAVEMDPVPWSDRREQRVKGAVAHG